MSHIVGTVQAVSPVLTIGPDSGSPPGSPNTWTVDFAHTPAPTGTKFLILHFQNVSLPASNRLEVDLGYDTDVFTSANGISFWTRPVNVYVLPGGLVPIRYITSGAGTGSVQLDQYGRGEQHAGEPGHPSISNCDPFLKDPVYTEPTYDPWWYCVNPPNWENAACVTNPADIRAEVARSVGMIVTVETSEYTGILEVSTCSVTLVDADKVLTAGHCHTPAEALTGSVTFDYHVNCDGSRPAGYNPRFYKVVSVINQQYVPGGNDYSLLQLAQAPAGVAAIQMRPDIPGPGEQIFGVHHPNGAVKKLSIPHPGFDTVLASDATEVNVPTNFHVSGGSSGSGLFDMVGRITGVLSNGDPCGHSGTVVPLKYFPTASILQAIAPAPPPPVTRDVMVVFDRSGSMSQDDGTGRTKIEAARDALSLFVELVRSGVGNRVGLESFSTTASAPVDFAIAPVDAAHKVALVGPPPYSGGTVGGEMPGGATSIGEGLDAARLQFPAPGTNPRAILLLTDGMENTPRWISDVAGSLAGIDVHAIGFGSATNLNGALLSSLASTHNGYYTNAESGLALEKFFSHAFGNIFEAGILTDPEYDLPADQQAGMPQTFNVCGEDGITIVCGWDRTDATLLLEVKTPGGATIVTGTMGTEAESGRTWTFLRIPLPFGGERDGLWTVAAFRPGGGEFPPPEVPLRFFINVIPTGGPRLMRMQDDRRYYTGDTINPIVYLRYADESWPHGAQVQVTVSRPNASAGNILTGQRLQAPQTLNGDTIPARQATLMALEAAAGKALVSYTDETLDLSTDAASTNGVFEPAGVFGKVLQDKLAMEGEYTFHFRATYGEGCTATRELLWSLHVDVGIDPGSTVVTVAPGGTRPDGSQDVTITLTPRDKYGNNLGPGRPGDLSLGGTAGTTLTGPVVDNGDGSYTVSGVWDPTSGEPPGTVIGQPGRPPVVVHGPHVAGKGGCAKLPCPVWLVLLLVPLLLFVLLLKWILDKDDD